MGENLKFYSPLSPINLKIYNCLLLQRLKSETVYQRSQESGVRCQKIQPIEFSDT